MFGVCGLRVKSMEFFRDGGYRRKFRGFKEVADSCVCVCFRIWEVVIILEVFECFQ